MKLKTVFILITLAITFVFEASSQKALVASDVEPELRTELNTLKPYLGTWTLKTKTKDGRPVRAKSEFTVGIDGNFLVENMFYRNEDGKEYQEYHAIWRWDVDSKKVVCHRFLRDGSHQLLKPVVKTDADGKSTITTITSKPGSPVAVQETIKIIDDKSYSWKAIVSGAKDSPAMEGTWTKQ